MKKGEHLKIFPCVVLRSPLISVLVKSINGYEANPALPSMGHPGSIGGDARSSTESAQNSGVQYTPTAAASHVSGGNSYEQKSYEEKIDPPFTACKSLRFVFLYIVLFV